MGDPHGTRVALDGTLDFDTAREVLGQGSRAIESSELTTIDFAGVGRCNSAGLALMIEWLAVARRANRRVRFAHVPDGLRQLARVCQVEYLLADSLGPVSNQNVGAVAPQSVAG